MWVGFYVIFGNAVGSKELALIACGCDSIDTTSSSKSTTKKENGRVEILA